jgi:hypothetical protein
LILDAFGTIPFILDCIGSKDGSVAPIAKIAKKGSKVAILLPVIVKVASETEEPEFEMDVSKSATWADGVDARGVRTHFYLQVRSIHLAFARRSILTLGLRMSSSKKNCSQPSCQCC